MEAVKERLEQLEQELAALSAEEKEARYTYAKTSDPEQAAKLGRIWQRLSEEKERLQQEREMLQQERRDLTKLEASTGVHARR